MNKYITTSFFVLGGLMVNAQTKKTDTLSSKDKEIEQVELLVKEIKSRKVWKSLQDYRSRSEIRFRVYQ